MSKVESSSATAEDPSQAWAQSLKDVLRDVVVKLPDDATLGELVEAARGNAHMKKALSVFSVAELIELAKNRPREAKKKPEVDADGNPIAADGPAVIRRRADVPDGDVRVLRTLAKQGPVRESELASVVGLTAEQTRLILRSLRSKGQIHIEGSGPKRRVKITRGGSGYLRKLDRKKR